LTTQGRTAEAEQAIRDGLAFCERFATEHPSDIWAQEELGLALYDLSNLVAARGQLEEAEAISGRAIKILDRVATDSPAGPYYRQNQAWGHQARAGILDRLNRGADAEQAYRRAMDLFAKLASDYPFHGFPQFASDSRLDLSRFLVRSGRTEDARDIWRKAIAAARKQADEVPDNPEYRVDLGRSLLRLADLLRSAAKHDEAEAALSEALIAFKELASRSPHPREDRYRRDAAGALRELGDQLRGAGRTADALAALRLAVDLYTGLPSAESQNNLAWLLATCPETALRDPRRGVELAAKAVELKPNQGMYWNTLGVAQYGAGDWKAAIKALTKSQELGNLSPAHDWFFLAMAEWQLGNQDAARGWYDKADQWLNENQKALEGTPDMAEELKRFRAEARDVLGIKDQ
jgi:tetratricopeptide (TPR) repeat protein